MMNLEGRRVGLCLSSGFFGYYAHCGFMQAVLGRGVEPAAITGCSAGALLGGLWASGLTTREIREAIFAVSPLDLIDPPRLGQLLSGPFGVLSGRRLQAMLERTLPVTTFEECSIPFAVSTFDLALGALRYVDSGSLARGIRASSSLPGMFSPTLIDGHPCWDGATAEKSPLGPLLDRDDLDLILVCYIARPQTDLPPSSFMACLRLAIDSLVFQADQRKIVDARQRGQEIVVIAPRVPRCGPHKMSEGPRIVEIAERETLRILDQTDFGCEELR